MPIAALVSLRDRVGLRTHAAESRSPARAAEHPSLPLSMQRNTAVESVDPANWVANVCSARVAGPLTTAPLVLKREPWHGHT